MSARSKADNAAARLRLAESALAQAETVITVARNKVASKYEAA